MGIGGEMCVLRICECHRCIVHRPDHIAGEGEQAVDARAVGGHETAVVVLFRPVDSLIGYEVWISAVPSSGHRASVKIHKHVEVSRILQNVQIIIHHILLVALEKVDFHSCNTQTSEPSEFLHTAFMCKHPVARRAPHPIVRSPGIIPHQRLYALRQRIFHGILQPASVAHFIPFPVEQHIFPSHGSGQIHIALTDFEILCAVIICPVHPCGAPGFYPGCILHHAWLAHILHKCALNNIVEISDNKHAPWRFPFPGPYRIDGADAIPFSGAGIGYGICSTLRAVREMCGAIHA